MQKRKTKTEIDIRFSKWCENEKQKAKFKSVFQCHAKTKNGYGTWILFSNAIEKRLALRYTHCRRFFRRSFFSRGTVFYIFATRVKYLDKFSSNSDKLFVCSINSANLVHNTRIKPEKKKKNYLRQDGVLSHFVIPIALCITVAALCNKKAVALCNKISCRTL